MIIILSMNAEFWGFIFWKGLYKFTFHTSSIHLYIHPSTSTSIHLLPVLWSRVVVQNGNLQIPLHIDTLQPSWDIPRCSKDNNPSKGLSFHTGVSSQWENLLKMSKLPQLTPLNVWEMRTSFALFTYSVHPNLEQSCREKQDGGLRLKRTSYPVIFGKTESEHVTPPPYQTSRMITVAATLNQLSCCE